MLEKKQYFAIDLMKFVLAVLLICAHVSSEKLSFPVYIDVWFSLYIIAVPFFFTTSAFFFFKKLTNEEDKSARLQHYKRYTKRILLMYLMWSLIYTCFIVAHWVQTDSLTLEAFGKHVFYSITYSSYPTIWFLPSLWVAVSLVYFCWERKMKVNSILLVSLLLYAIGWMMYTFPKDRLPFANILEWYDLIFKSPRNGFFNGFIYAAIGAYIAINYSKIFSKNSKSFIIYYVVSAILLGGAVTEALLSKKFINPQVDANFVFLLIPFTYFFVIATAKTELKPSPIYLSCRNLSLLLFLSQRIFLTAIPLLLPVGIVAAISSNPYIGLLIFLGSTFVFSLLIVKLSSRYKFLKVLW